MRRERERERETERERESGRESYGWVEEHTHLQVRSDGVVWEGEAVGEERPRDVLVSVVCD